MSESEQILSSEEEVEIDLRELIQFFKGKLKYIVLCSMILGMISGVITHFLISDKYESTARLFLKPEVSNGIIDSSQLSSNEDMVNNYIVLLEGNNIQSQAADKLNMDVDELSQSLSIGNVSNTQVITITSKTTNPVISQEIVDTVVDVFTEEIEEKLDITNIIVVDQAKVSDKAVEPSLAKNVIIAAILGMGISSCYFLVKFLLDTHIHNKKDAEKYLGIAVLGVVPWFED